MESESTQVPPPLVGTLVACLALAVWVAVRISVTVAVGLAVGLGAISVVGVAVGKTVGVEDFPLGLPVLASLVSLVVFRSPPLPPLPFTLNR